jgi:hypothetical protein
MALFGWIMAPRAEFRADCFSAVTPAPQTRPAPVLAGAIKIDHQRVALDPRDIAVAKLDMHIRSEERPTHLTRAAHPPVRS